jgi:hypothetical protein
MKYKSKIELVEDCEKEWTKLWKLLDDFEVADLERRAGRGDSARSITDHLAHVHAWHRLLLGWLKSGPNGNPDLPVKGFKWNQTRSLNQMLFEEFKHASFVSVRRKLKLSHGRVIKRVNGFSNRQLIQPGQFVWTKKLGLVSYVGPNTAGHYRWAQKKIQRF